jgi:hypothetical protein
VAEDDGRQEGESVAPVTHVDPRDRPECQRYIELISTPLATIRTLPKDELVRRYDELLALDHPLCSVQRLYIVGPDDYRDELNRRVAERQTTWLVRLTWVIVILTAVLSPLSLAGFAPSPHTDTASRVRTSVAS